MKHPKSQLAEYAMRALPPDEARAVEAHVLSCEVCQAELRQLDAALVALVESLPPVTPPAACWERIEAQLERQRAAPSAEPEPAPSAPRPGAGWPWPRGAWVLAAAIGVLLVGASLLWCYRQQQAYQQLEREQQLVAAWLARGDVETRLLQARDGALLGRVLLLPDGRALFVLREPPAAGRAYQAWGHTGDGLASLVVSERPVFEVLGRGFEALYLSLEPKGGSPQPTTPLGRLER